jgi:hypothetical protein
MQNTGNTSGCSFEPMEDQYQSVTVPKAAFFFCRYTIAVLAWAAWALKLKVLMVLVLAILALSAWLTIRRAPLILLYTHTLHRWFPSAGEELSVSSMRFAHALGTVLAAICLAVLFVNEPLGWGVTMLFCVIKTVSALGLCPAYKLHRCMVGGACCAFLKRR